MRSRPERRLAEAVAGIVFEASHDDPLSRRVAIVAATAAAEHEPAPLPDLIRSAFIAALAAVEEEIAFVAGRLAEIKATRSRERLAEIAAARAPLLAKARRIDREIVWLRAAIARDEHGPPWAAKASRWGRERDLPRLEARLAELRRQTPAYRLPAAKRCRIEEFTTRLKRLRATARALRRVRRDLGPRPAARKAA